jgi:hypothetical protein
MSKSFKLRLGDIELELPGDFEQEVAIASRGQNRDGYRPNVRVSLRSAPAVEVSLETLAKEYETRLCGEIPGLALSESSAREISGLEALELHFQAEPTPGSRIFHRVLIAVRQGAVITIGASSKDRSGFEPVFASLLTVGGAR